MHGGLSLKKHDQNHRMARSISDASCGEFRRKLEYKTKWQYKVLVVVDPPASCALCTTYSSQGQKTSQCENGHARNTVYEPRIPRFQSGECQAKLLYI